MTAYSDPASGPDALGQRAVVVDPARLDRAARHTAAVLLTSVIAVVVVIVFWPGPPDPSGQDALHRYLAQAHANGLPYWISFNLIQNLANLVMFIPLGFGITVVRPPD